MRRRNAPGGSDNSYLTRTTLQLKHRLDQLRKPRMTETPSRRRWFQFSLGTMFLLVAAFAAWLGWEMSLIRERRMARVTIEDAGGRASNPSPSPILGTAVMEPIPPATIPFWRRWLGDEAVTTITLRHGASDADINATRQLFQRRPFRSIHSGTKHSPSDTALRIRTDSR